MGDPTSSATCPRQEQPNMRAVSTIAVFALAAAVLTVAAGETSSGEFFYEEEIPPESLLENGNGGDLRAAVGAAKGVTARHMRKIVRKLTHKSKGWIKHKIIKSARKIQSMFPKLHLKGVLHTRAKTTKKSTKKPKAKVPKLGYTWQDAKITRGGHYKLGGGRRRIGAGFGRRRRTKHHKGKKKVFHRLLSHLIKVKKPNCHRCIQAFLKAGGCKEILYHGKRAKDYMPRKIGKKDCRECTVPAAKRCPLKKIVQRHTPHRRRRRAQTPRKYIDLSKKKFSSGNAVQCKSFMLRTRTGKKPRSATTSMPKVTLVGTKGKFSGLLQTGRKGKVEVTTLVTGHIGALVEIRLEATSTDGWYFTRFETRACDFTVDVNPGKTYPGTKWQDFGCTHRWLDGRPYNDEPSLYRAPYSNRIVLRRVNSVCAAATKLRKARARAMKRKVAELKVKAHNSRGKSKKKTFSGTRWQDFGRKKKKKGHKKKEGGKKSKKRHRREKKEFKEKQDGVFFKSRSAKAKEKVRKAKRKYKAAIKAHAKKQKRKELSQKLKAAAKVSLAWHMKERYFKSKEARHKWKFHSEGVKAAEWVARKNKNKGKKKHITFRKKLNRWDVYKKAKRVLSPRHYAWLKRTSFRAAEKMWKARVARRKVGRGASTSSQYKQMRRLITSTAEMRTKARVARRSYYIRKAKAKEKKAKKAKKKSKKKTKKKKTKKKKTKKKAKKKEEVAKAAIEVTKAEDAVMASSEKMTQEAHKVTPTNNPDLTPENRKMLELKAQVVAARAFVNTAKQLVKKAKQYEHKKENTMWAEEAAMEDDFD